MVNKNGLTRWNLHFPKRLPDSENFELASLLELLDGMHLDSNPNELQLSDGSCLFSVQLTLFSVLMTRFNKIGI